MFINTLITKFKQLITNIVYKILAIRQDTTKYISNTDFKI